MYPNQARPGRAGPVFRLDQNVVLSVHQLSTSDIGILRGVVAVALA